ncbi:MerR family transcriptional regulator [Nostoc flagelliforme FACHB-838]|uniref:MerR family transcriptional regulator n=1 Tax=Nostoc flagelliforme FACHB-838 TaxID=2692904 RepID=A0ABR8DQ00_9NOSO|nr:MerR family transcriptional regulator [Nostoc flagelliforme]MBD2530975.1 MerR family transcriptional regulator [Nostoc flagelliforme FACHB-838]
MQEEFFTSKQAAEITNCTLRQLQYWREKEVVVPVIGDTGIGRSIYYSRSNLIELAAMAYWLSMGLNFDLASRTLRQIKEQEPELLNSGQGGRFMLLWNWEMQSLELVEFNRERAILNLSDGLPVIPVWLDLIYSRVESRLLTGEN